MFYKVTADIIYRVKAKNEEEARNRLKDNRTLSAWKVIGEPTVESWGKKDKMEESGTSWGHLEKFLGKWTDSEIAKKAGISRQAVRYRRKQLGIKSYKEIEYGE